MTLVAINQLVDAKGLSCPMPIVKTAQAVKSLPSGATVEVLATDPGSVKDFAAWCRTTGHELLESSSDGAVYRTYVTTARGLEPAMGYYGLLDRTPMGRNEQGEQDIWLRRHDEYETA